MSNSLFRSARKLALVVAGLAACTADDGASPSTSTTTADLDVIGLAERPASLLVLSPTATVAQRQRLERALVKMGGAVLETHAPRLVIAQVPAGADAALAALGVVSKFDRAVTPADLASPTIFEERFLSVHAARWFPTDVPVGGRIEPLRVAHPAGEEESAPREAPIAPGEPGGGGGPTGPVIDPEDQQAVPFASGTVVVSIVLPESNGAIDVSTEDWNEDLVRQTYLKVQAAIDRIAASEPNADLKFVVHYESAPAAGGLPGTVDTDYEFGQRAQWGSSTEGLATADILSSILGRTVTENDMWLASIEYTASLKQRYGADAAFMVIVAANGNYTAGLRAHAYIGGPLTVLDTGYGHETFMHEFGHIFGAYDEYCPDACSPPTSIHGYLGIYNANAYYQEGGPGIDDGRGEGAPSLMQYNQPGAVNGYTRGAWGWLDTDGDGIVEVRDTFPKSALTATVSGNRVRVTGTITDRGESRTFGNIRYSANRIVGLEFAFGANGPWFPVALAGDTRGRQAVDVELGTVPAGTRSIFVRGVSSVGNVEPRAQELRVTTTTTGNTAPYVRLDVPARAGTAAPVTLVTTAVDLEGGATQVRYDVDGNGTWDTTYRAPGSFSTTLPAGLRTVKAQVKDAAGLTRIATAEVLVVSGAMAPVLSLTNLSSLVHGVTPANVAMTATAPGATGIDVVTELATDDDTYVVKGSAGAGGSVMASLPTPISLKSTKLDLTAGDSTLMAGWIRDIIALDADHVAVASGSKGIWILDITNRAAPRVMSKLVLETSANRLFKSGTRLYVLGTYLTVVDIRDLSAPREWKQLTAVNETVAMESQEVLDIPDAAGWGVTHFYGFGQGAKISSARVTVTVDHPRIADLVIRLVPGKGSGIEPVVLRDHVSGAGGLRTFTYSTTSNAALRAVIGQFADDYWTVEVTDDVGNGQVGRLVASRVEFRTSAKAVDVVDNATEVAGFTSWGDLVVAGAGVETLDVTLPYWITSLSRVSGTATQGATMVGDTAVVSMALEAKSKDGTVTDPTLRGLCAIDLRSSFFPRVIRCEKEIGGQIGEFATVAGRLYQGIQPVCNREEGCNGQEPFTIVGDLSAFACNRASWQLGSTPLRVDHWAFGDARQVWTIGFSGSVQQLDVTSPTAVSVLKSYPRTWTARMVKLRLPEVMLFDYSPQARIARLGDEQSILSRVYRITVEARNAAGGVTRASRTVHVVPYDHAPAVLSATVGRKDETQPWRLQVTANDGDNGATWDPTLFARVDFDADGVFDTDWAWMGQDGTGAWTGDVDFTGVASGAYPAAVVEVRDGFWARNRATFALTIP